MAVRIRVPKDIWRDLQASLRARDARRLQDYARQIRRTEGRTVAFLAIDDYRGMRFEIRADEHPPPHFHILTKTGDASYRITDCKRLAGNLDVSARILKRWWRANRRTLVKIWNETRPTDCPVGRMAMPAGW
jgi:hypothetical protein